MAYKNVIQDSTKASSNDIFIIFINFIVSKLIMKLIKNLIYTIRTYKQQNNFSIDIITQKF